MIAVIRKLGATTIVIPIVVALVSFFGTISVARINASAAAQEKMAGLKEELKEADALLDKANAVQDTNIETMKKDITEIKGDVKALLGALGVKK